MKLKDILIAIFITIIWGAAFAIIQMGLKGFPPIFNASLRFLCAAFPLFLFVKRPKVSLGFLLLYGLNYVIMFSLMYVGMKVGMPSGLTSLILQSSVLFAAILATIILKDKPSGIQKTGIILGLSGVILIATDSESFGSLLSFALVLGAAFFYGASSILMKSAGKNVDMFSLIVWGCLIPPVPLFVLSLFLEENHLQVLSEITPMGITSILYTGLLGTILAFALWGRLLKKYSANQVVPFNLLTPVFGMLVSYLLLGEIVTLKVAIAFIIILSGLLCVVLEKRISKFIQSQRLGQNVRFKIFKKQ
ncbi:EamA family transporter [Aquimarina sp. RZ0]|uniref:EamA family transporter n=1 Tax=Aquimarina sp. RZ0 TaxID=2607730 RepID=UPI0011F0DEA4|nr:EamA family transporter [Aquimarina sp. RZ0]KAA1243936.1 EamA family transporter [Aquimarina sp. RZ0]